MTTDDLPLDTPDDVRAAIVEARQARDRAERQLRQLQRTRRELSPVWERLGLAAREDSYGLELEVALIPRGVR